MPPLIGPDNSVSFDDIEKAECLADSLELQCSPSLLPADPVHVANVDFEVERLASRPPTADLATVTVEEVNEIIRHLPVKKAPGLDGISNRVLRLLPEQIIFLLVVIFNAAIKNCVFPNIWKDACVIGIPKPGKPKHNPTSYRPISLIKTMGKLFERLLLNRLTDHVHSNKILIDEQFGFRAKHSCVNQVHRLTEHILFKFQQRQHTPTGALFFDVAKAFDKVWHNGLLYKLFTFGVPDRLVLILRDYLSNRHFQYRVEGILSSPRPIRAGVPQGSILAPLLYSLYTNDIPKYPGVKLALFADDTALYASNRDIDSLCELLQAATTNLGDWFRKWRIEVNPEKSVAILFSRSSRYSPAANLTLFDRTIPWVEQVKYLGVTLDKRLSFKPHIKVVRDRAAFFLGRLYPLLCKRSKMSLRNKLTLYKTIIRPVMTYASVVFAHSSRTTLRPLQTLQNKFLRIAVGAPFYMRNIDLHDDLELESIASFMRTASRRYFDKLPHHPNQLLVNACNNYGREIRVTRGKRRPRHVLLDPDDPITAALKAAPPKNSEVHTRTSFIPRHRRRRRRIVQSTVANRCVYAPRRSSTPTQP